MLVSKGRILNPTKMSFLQGNLSSHLKEFKKHPEKDGHASTTDNEEHDNDDSLNSTVAINHSSTESSDDEIVSILF